MVKKEDLKTCFEFFDCNVEDDAVLHKCMDLCDLWEIEEETFVEKWVAFCAGRSITNLNPTLESLKEMEHAEAASNRNKTDLEANAILTRKPSIFEAETEEDNILGMYGCNQTATPKSKRMRSPVLASIAEGERKLRAVECEFTPSTYTPQSNTPNRYPASHSRGVSLIKFGENVPSWEKKSDYALQIRKVENTCTPSEAMYMFEMLSRKGPVLTFVCQTLGGRLMNLWSKVKKADMQCTKDVTTQSNSAFRTFGMISCNAETKSINLESCSRTSFGRETPTIGLNLELIKHYSVYSGQIVAVEGTNVTGKSLLVKDIFMKGYAPKSGTPDFTEQLNILVAAGPFTQNDNLNYQPLWDLMEHVRNEEPHLLILIGPFLEHTHPEIENATIKHTFQELFEMLVKKIVDQIKGKSIQVVLVASNRDAHHEPVYPTPEYFIPKSLSIPNIHLMPDPCVLDVEGLTIGITSVDILRHLSSVEMSNNSAGDRLSRLFDYILAQTCFYPLYPPVEDLNVDTILWEKYAFFDKQPHLMILPSDMQYVCKVVNDSMILNPERLQKLIYAKLQLRPAVNGKWTIKNNVSCQVAKV